MAITVNFKQVLGWARLWRFCAAPFCHRTSHTASSEIPIALECSFDGSIITADPIAKQRLFTVATRLSSIPRSPYAPS